MPPYKPGQSGNPKGRPKKNRALSEILERAGSKTSGGVSNKRAVALMAWNLARHGMIVLENGRILEIKEPAELVALWRFIYSQVDGPPPADHNLNLEGSITLVVDTSWRSVKSDSQS